MNLYQTNLRQETLKKFLGEGAEAIGPGVDATISPTNDQNYEEFKNAPAGSLTSLLFWNKEQACCSGTRNKSAVLEQGTNLLFWNKEQVCCSV